MTSWILSGLSVILSIGWIPYATTSARWPQLYLWSLVLAAVLIAFWHFYLRHQDLGNKVNPSHLAFMAAYVSWLFSIAQWMRFKTYSAAYSTNPEEVAVTSILATEKGMLLGSVLFMGLAFAAFYIKWNTELQSSSNKR